MSRISDLQRHSRRIARTLFASLPLEVRLAYVIASLVELRALGRSLGVILIKKRIQGLPDIRGVPALEFPIEQYEAQHKDPSKYLPPDYLSHFAADLRRDLLAKFHDESLVDNAISDWLFKFVVEGEWKQIREGEPLGAVFRYVLVTLGRMILSMIRTKVRKKMDYGQSLDLSDEEGAPIHQPADPESEAKFYHNIPTNQLPAVRRDLERQVHPDAPLYLDLLLQGYSPAEILGFKNHQQTDDIMLPRVKQEGNKAPYAYWKSKLETKIRKVLEKYM